MADVLLFDPASEFEVIQEFTDFEEDVQRKEYDRFYTIEEQLNDYVEKSVSSIATPTRFQLKKIDKERDRIQLAYEKSIRVTDTEYVVDLSRKSVKVSWVKPVYAEFAYSSYNYETNWRPFSERERRNIPNYYRDLINALPKPYSPSNQNGRPSIETQELVDADGLNNIKTLGPIEITRTYIREDGTMQILRIPLAGTEDNIRILGYRIDRKPVDVPYPLADHPFLKSREPAKIETTELLNDAFPSISAILEHGVPVTIDPYEEGVKYLKVYDIRLSQIPWSSWKTKFPPADQKESISSIKSLEFPEPVKESAPSENIQKIYTVDWYSGYHSRFWLAKQIDSGTLISKILLAESATKIGLLAATPVEIPPVSYPPSEPEVCMQLTNDFDTFLQSGVYRTTEKGGVCVPAGDIQRERGRLAFTNRLVWKETTNEDIKKEYIRLLNSFQVKETEEVFEKYAKIPVEEMAERRRDVIAITKDENRDPADKAYAIEKITVDLELSNRKFLDVAGKFVVCQHTLAELKGDLEEDRLKYYAEWAVVVDGYRVCKYCGEQVNSDVTSAQDEYDEDGRKIISFGTLEQNAHSGNAQFDDLKNSLLELRKNFDLNNPAELILYSMLSWLQILPEESQVLPIIQYIRRLSRAYRASTAAKSEKDLIECLFGVTGTVVILQIHNPFLVPKRKFGGRSVITTGFPRDTDDENESPIVDSLLYVVKSIFSAYPGEIKAPIISLVRLANRKPAEAKTKMMPFLKRMYADFKTHFESAKERYVPQDEVEVERDIDLPMINLKKTEFLPSERLSSEEKPFICVNPILTVSWQMKTQPSYMQDEITLFDGIKPSINAQSVSKEVIEIELNKISDKEIGAMVKKGLPSGFPAFSEFLKKDPDGNSFFTLSSRILDVLSKTKMKKDKIIEFRILLNTVDTRISMSLYRDLMKGIFFDILSEIKSDATLVRAINEKAKTDLTMRMILLSKDAAEKEEEVLRSRERNDLKAYLRRLNDDQREIIRNLLSLGIAEFIITNEDRERFAKEYTMETYSDPDEQLPEFDMNMPEEGYNATRDYVENGDQPMMDGVEMQVDYGDYGDRAIRDYNDYGNQPSYDLNEEDGI